MIARPTTNTTTPTTTTTVTARIDPQTLPGRPCSVASALELVGDRWSLLVVRELLLGNHRFSELARNTGAPRDRLAARLKTLVETGLVERRPYQDTPPREDYHLTRAGRELTPVIQSLLQWGDRWAVTSPPMVQHHHDHRLVPTTVCATCGERVRRGDVTQELRPAPRSATRTRPISCAAAGSGTDREEDQEC